MNVNRVSLLLVITLLGGCATSSLGRVDWDNAARQRYADSAEQGDMNAQYELGVAYCCGTGFYSTAEAIKWWCRAAKQGHEPALQKLHKYLLTGINEGCRRHDPATEYAFEIDA